MKFSKFGMLAVASLSLAAISQAKPGISIEVVPALAPNLFGSPSGPAWVANAITALKAGAATAGTPGSPTFYEALKTQNVYANQVQVTSTNSWLGQLNPGTAFGPAYANEYGNRLHFGIHIMGNGTKFSISQLKFDASSTDPDNALGFSFAAGDYQYSSAYVGINYGPDGKRGTSDDVTITSGANTQLVDELVGRGSGNAFWPDFDISNPTQQQINDAIMALNNMFFTGSYALVNGTGGVIASGSAKVHIKAVH